jgi:hypothetical protein
MSASESLRLPGMMDGGNNVSREPVDGGREADGNARWQGLKDPEVGSSFESGSLMNWSLKGVCGRSDSPLDCGAMTRQKPDLGRQGSFVVPVPGRRLLSPPLCWWLMRNKGSIDSREMRFKQNANHRRSRGASCTAENRDGKPIEAREMQERKQKHARCADLTRDAMQ